MKKILLLVMLLAVATSAYAANDGAPDWGALLSWLFDSWYGDGGF